MHAGREAPEIPCSSSERDRSEDEGKIYPCFRKKTTEKREDGKIAGTQ